MSGAGWKTENQAAAKVRARQPGSGGGEEFDHGLLLMLFLSCEGSKNNRNHSGSHFPTGIKSSSGGFEPLDGWAAVAGGAAWTRDKMHLRQKRRRRGGEGGVGAGGALGSADDRHGSYFRRIHGSWRREGACG